jgi:hypothetical protein
MNGNKEEYALKFPYRYITDRAELVNVGEENGKVKIKALTMPMNDKSTAISIAIFGLWIDYPAHGYLFIEYQTV